MAAVDSKQMVLHVRGASPQGEMVAEQEFERCSPARKGCLVNATGRSAAAPVSSGDALELSEEPPESPVEAPKPPLAAHGQAVDAPEPSGDGSNWSGDGPDWSVETPGKP